MNYYVTEGTYDKAPVAEYKYDVLLQNAKNNPDIDYVVNRTKNTRHLIVMKNQASVANLIFNGNRVKLKK